MRHAKGVPVLKARLRRDAMMANDGHIAMDIPPGPVTHRGRAVMLKACVPHDDWDQSDRRAPPVLALKPSTGRFAACGGAGWFAASGGPGLTHQGARASCTSDAVYSLTMISD